METFLNIPLSSRKVIQFITFYLLGVILLLLTVKDMKITDSRETPTKVQSVPLAWEPPGNRIPVKLHTSSI